MTSLQSALKAAGSNATFPDWLFTIRGDDFVKALQAVPSLPEGSLLPSTSAERDQLADRIAIRRVGAFDASQATTIYVGALPPGTRVNRETSNQDVTFSTRSIEVAAVLTVVLQQPFGATELTTEGFLLLTAAGAQHLRDTLKN